ncbi:MAG: oligoribonuclease [Candidatus Saccharimonadales bacterium]|jgi:oligoribonuclease
MIDKKSFPTKFLWVDLEMTGLVPDKDVILEVAAEVTDAKLETIGSYESKIKHNKDLVLRRMQQNNWWDSYPDNRDEFLNSLDKAKQLKQVEKELIDLVDEHFGSEPAVLAGNSIHSDRAFIKQWMPELDLKLHYRMLDVTSWKLIMQSMYNVDFEKSGVHRAFEDIQASIAELQFYLEWFKENKD